MYKLVISAVIIFGALNANSEASLAAEPHNDEHLKQYAQNPAFDASVSLGTCSASRIQIDTDDPVDFYLTAAHCLHENSSNRLQVDTSIIKALEEIAHLETKTSLDRIPTHAILEKHFANFDDEDIRAANLVSKSKSALIENLTKILKSTSAYTFLAELNPTDSRSINIKDVDFVKHPDASKDIAIFTTRKKTSKPKYNLYNGQLENVLGKTVTNVAFGTSLLNKAPMRPERQAFDSTVERIEYTNVLVSIPFQPDLNRTLNDSPLGVITKGDSGGSLLIKEKDMYKLIGVSNGSYTGDVELSYYENIPDSLRSNTHNQVCFQQLKTDGTQGHCCYGTRTIWAGVDLNFIANAKKSLLAKMPTSKCN